LYGCETWSLTIREEHRLRVFENSMEEVAGGWGILNNEELNNLYAPPNNIRIIKLRRDGACNMEWNRALGRPRHRREDNIRMDLREIGWEDVNWMHLA
jgi:hypothetical protein